MTDKKLKTVTAIGDVVVEKIGSFGQHEVWRSDVGDDVVSIYITHDSEVWAEIKVSAEMVQGHGFIHRVSMVDL